MFFQLSHKTFVVFGRKAGVHRYHIGRGRHVDDGCEVRHRVIGHLGVDGRIGRYRGHGGHAQRIAIGRGLGGFISTDHAAAAGLVLDHHALAQGLGQRLGQHPGNDIGRATRGKRHLQLDDLVGIALGQGTLQGCEACRNKAGKNETTVAHGELLRWCAMDIKADSTSARRREKTPARMGAVILSR